MRKKSKRWAAIVSILALSAVARPAQSQGRADVLEAIAREGTERSRLEALAQVLLDSIGPRLTGTPAQKAAHDWAVSTYRAWGVDARNEEYGTWTAWRRGVTHVDLVQPRVRSLEATLLAWSPGTEAPVEAPVVVLPQVANPEEFRAWLATARGKWVLVDPPQPTCRPDDNWERWATPESFARMKRGRDEAAAAWERRVAATGLGRRWIPMQLDQAGVAGVLSAHWSGGWGTTQVYNAWTLQKPMLVMGCEDYGLLFRLAERGQGPVVRVRAEAAFEGDVPVFNTVATIPGAEKPDEYVLLSAHFDSWDGASGATDNGSGTVAVMEAMRILRAVVPRPRRTIVAGHWSGEEQGLTGSLSFAADRPEVVRGLQAVFNLDQGTGRVSTVSMQGLAAAEPFFRRWFGRIPDAFDGGIDLVSPGAPENRGSDHSSFVCRGVPAFNLEQTAWDYRTATWHTDRDTYDKLVFDDVRRNAVLLAMLAYLASEDPDRLPRAPEGAALPECRKPARSMIEFIESMLQ